MHYDCSKKIQGLNDKLSAKAKITSLENLYIYGTPEVLLSFST